MLASFLFKLSMVGVNFNSLQAVWFGKQHARLRLKEFGGGAAGAKE